MKHLLRCIVACVVVMAASKLASAQSFIPFNPPPCDFSNQFYDDNGIDATSQATELNAEPDGRFGLFRKTGPPATGTQVNWVNDSNCSINDPTRTNVRILATTGGNSDDGNSPFTSGQNETLEFISILAFLHAQSVFENNYSRTVGAIGPNGGLDNQQTNPGEVISIGTFEGQSSPAANPRNITMQFIVSNFEAYAAVKQTLPDGTFATNPCAADMASSLAPPTPCFSVADSKDGNGNTISDVATPNLRQDWRFATNRNAIDGSDNNCINLMDSNCKHGLLSDSPFGYFCDDLLGMWILTYFWFTQPPNTTVEPCKDVFANIGAKNGFNLDGTPIILTADELNNQIEANGCGAEGKEDPAGGDKGAVWLVCPALPDPRNGAIASDAFLDAVKLPSGSFQDSLLAQNFTCLQQTGKFCGESAPQK